MKKDRGERYRGISVTHTLIMVAALFLITNGVALSQSNTKEKPPLKERLFYGGGIGLQFGTITDIELTPVVGLWVLPRLGIAAGPTFRYYKNPIYSTAIYGGRTYLEYIILQDFDNMIPIGLHLGLFLHSEYEVISLESIFKDPNASGRFILGTFLAGGGIRQPIGARSSLNLTFLWALNDSGYGIYGNPEIRISFMF